MADARERARAREWRPDDASVLARAWNDQEIARWNPVPDDRSEAAARRWIENLRDRSPESAIVDLAIVDDADSVVGEIGLRIDRERAVAELGFWVDPTRRRQGWGRRLLELASARADELGLRGLIAVSDARNETAASLFAACGWLEVRAADGRRGWVDRRL